jgi:hypothetical protein
MATKKYPNVPMDEVGDMVQNEIDAGATAVHVTANADGRTCTVTVTK